MRKKAEQEWELFRKGILRMIPKDEKAREEDWNWTVEHKAYYGSGDSHLGDCFKLFALREDEIAEVELELALRCLEKADELDDCYMYGKMYEQIRDIVVNGKSFTSQRYTQAKDDGVEPWHDEDLGRALRVRMLFTARWLKSGTRDQALLLRAINYLKMWLDMSYALPPDSPQAKRTSDTTGGHIAKFTQWCVEAKEYELAKEYCRKEVKDPLNEIPEGWNFTKKRGAVMYLQAAHESGERDLSQLFPEALDRCYRWICRQIGNGVLWYHCDEELLGLAYMRAERMGLGTEARELLRRIREDS